MTFARRVTLALAIASLSPVAASSVARAEPTPEDLASARDLFKEARALREKGDLLKALEKFRAAHALGQTPITGLELARTYVLVGRLVEAHEVSFGVARLPVASDETERSRTARLEAAKLAELLGPRLAKLVVEVKGLAPSAGAVVSIDGETVPPAALGEPRRVDPGRHIALLREANGIEVRATADLKEGESRTLLFDATIPPPPGVVLPSGVTAGPVVSPYDLPPAPHRRSNALVILGATTAGVGAVFGVSFGIVTFVAKSSLAADCPGGRCGPAYYGELSTAHNDATVSTVSFVVAGVGLGAAVLDLLLRPKKTQTARLEPEVGAGWVGFHGAF